MPVSMFLGQRPDHVEVVLRHHGGELLGLEDEVPDLQEAVLVRLRSAVGPELRAAVDVDLGARTARGRDAHVPVVVLQAAALDALGRYADAAPQLDRLDVAVG
jgi:hypothetical protein